MIFEVELTGQALRQVRKLLPREARQALEQILGALRENPLPRPPLIRKVVGVRLPVFRLRLQIAGEPWRAFYRIEGRVVTVFGLIPKKNVGRFLRHL